MLSLSSASERIPGFSKVSGTSGDANRAIPFLHSAGPIDIASSALVSQRSSYTKSCDGTGVDTVREDSSRDKLT